MRKDRETGIFEETSRSAGTASGRSDTPPKGRMIPEDQIPSGDFWRDDNNPGQVFFFPPASGGGAIKFESPEDLAAFVASLPEVDEI